MEELQNIEQRVRDICGTIEGSDSLDNEYDSIIEFWTAELARRKKSKGTNLQAAWYSDAYDYWESEQKCPVSDDGVLAGFGFLTPMDTRDSHLFLDSLRTMRPSLRFEKAADCGAGIGRVTKNMLLPRFQRVDMVEQSKRLLASAPGYIGDDAERVGYIHAGLQDPVFPAPQTYDCIWIQWVVGHLTDADYIAFFRRCSAGLREGGVIVLKDNCSEALTFMVDRDDSSVARHIEYHKVLLDLAGLKILMVRRQKDFPAELCPVVMFALVSADELA